MHILFESYKYFLKILTIVIYSPLPPLPPKKKIVKKFTSQINQIDGQEDHEQKFRSNKCPSALPEVTGPFEMDKVDKTFSIFPRISRYQASISFRRFSFNVSLPSGVRSFRRARPLPPTRPPSSPFCRRRRLVVLVVVVFVVVVARWLDGCTITMQARKPISTVRCRLGLMSSRSPL